MEHHLGAPVLMRLFNRFVARLVFQPQYFRAVSDNRHGRTSRGIEYHSDSIRFRFIQFDTMVGEHGFESLANGDGRRDGISVISRSNFCDLFLYSG